MFQNALNKINDTNSMYSYTNPTISLFISQIRKLSGKDKDLLVLYELKKLAADNTKEDEHEVIKIYKKLYLLNIGINVSKIDFIKAIANTQLEIKNPGYLGLSLLSPGNHLVLLYDVLQKDLENLKYISSALTFISHINEPDEFIKDLVLKTKISNEGLKTYLKYLVVRSIFDNSMFFVLNSVNNGGLYAKIQIILKRRLENKLTERDIKWLIMKIKTVDCKFLKLKILTLFYKLVLISKLPIDNVLISFLKTFLANLNFKIKKSIDMAIILEAIKVLIAMGDKSDRIEEFIFKLISSKDQNYQYLGFKYSLMLKILPEIVISKIFELGIDKTLYFDTLISLITKKSYKAIYQRLGQLKQMNVTGRIEILKREDRINIILEKLCEFGDQEFICKLLYENGRFYEKIRHKNFIQKDQCRSFFNTIVKSNLPEHFLIIYDLFPNILKTNEMIADLGLNHMKQLIKYKLDENHNILNNLIDFLCTNGDPKLNKRYILEYLVECKDVDVFLKSIELFNNILTEKFIYIEENQYISYYIKNYNLILSHSDKITVTIKQVDINNTSKSDKIQIYNIKGYRSINFLVKTVNRTILKTINIKKEL